MRSRPLHLAASVVLLVVVSACTGPTEELRQQAVEQVQAGVDRARDAAADLTDDERFCLAVTRAVTAIEAEAPATAEEAAEEVLAQAPDDLEDEAGAVVEELRRVLDGEGDLRSEVLAEAVEQLRSAAAPRCEPG